MKKIYSIVVLMILVVVTSCSTSGSNSLISTSSTVQNEAPVTGRMYLYGETHSVAEILDKEFELWHDYYHHNGMRHLFVELPHYGAEFLNLWMQASDDTILDEFFTDIQGTDMDSPQSKAFFQRIKATCPETVFHGVDVGHAYATMGKRYLDYLIEHDLADSPQYVLAEQSIQQGQKYYADQDHVYREAMLVQNCMREFDMLQNQDIMGIFGSLHIFLNVPVIDGTESMATQLQWRYGDQLSVTDLSFLSKELPALRIDTLLVAGKEYKAFYFGKQDLSTMFPDFLFREFWKLEDAYADFSQAEVTGDMLPFDNYPMNIELNQIYVIDYTYTDGSVERMVYRFDGYLWNGHPTTEQIVIP